MEQPFAFLWRYGKLSGYLREMRGLTPLDEDFHNEVVCTIHLLYVSNISSFPILLPPTPESWLMAITSLNSNFSFSGLTTRYGSWFRIA
jgi:hypothetical protein